MTPSFDFLQRSVPLVAVASIGETVNVAAVHQPNPLRERFSSARTLALVTLGLLLAGCGDHVEGKARAQVEDAKAVPQRAASDDAASAKTLRFSPDGSSIAFVGAKITGKHDGSFERFTGTIDLVDGDPTKSAVKVEIDMASVQTDAEKLTQHLMHSDFFEIETHPKSAFESTQIRPEGGNRYVVTGNLDLHGVKKSITFPAAIDVAGEDVTVKAEFAINRKDFGIVYAGAPDDLIKDDVLLVLNVRAKP